MTVEPVGVVNTQSSAGDPVRWVGCGSALVVLAARNPGQFSVSEGEWLPREEIPNMIRALQKADELLAEEAL